MTPLHLRARLRSFVRRLESARARQWVPQPLHRSRPSFRRGPRILLLAWFDPAGLKTIRDNIHEIGRHSRFRWDLMNLFGRASYEGFTLPRPLLAAYDAVFIHCTIAYDPDNLRYMLPQLARWDGLKILMKQDEQHRTRGTVRLIHDANFQLVLTCVPPSELAKVYPPHEVPRARFMHTLTGYVTDEMRALRYPFEDRSIDIGYRGSPQPMHFGRLSWEKQQIADIFIDVCRRRGLRFDIKAGWGDRFMGNAWFDFLGRSAGTLGVESGASIFDFDGGVERSVTAFLKDHPSATFEEVSRDVLAPYEGNVRYAQIAPRHLEAVACETAQLLYEGTYSGVFAANRHYLSVRRDLSNVDDVMDRFLDRAERRRMVATARAEIIDSEAHHYRSFVRALDEHVAAALT
jgi:hypothetical protein